MTFIARRSRVLGAVAAASLLAACSGTSGTLPSKVGLFGSSFSKAVIAIPAPCSGQRTKKTFASVAETLASGGGSICIPALAGFGGSFEYPSASPSIGASLISSPTNYNKKLPSLGTGTPLFYVQIALSGATVFGTNVPAGGGLVGPAFVPGHTYTALGQVSAFGTTVQLPGCWLKAGKSAFGGSIGGLGSLLKGQNVPAAVQGVIEIYAGKQASSKC